jgi:pimeloyl-ACP methyl ester carboxylesterase
MGEAVDIGDIELWTEHRGQEGPNVLLIAGLGDPAEAWQPQLDGLSERFRLTAFDNRGAGRTPLPEGRLSAGTMADDAAALLRALEVSSAHVAGFSMGSAIAQELALRHPELVRSLVLMSTYARPDALWRSHLNFWRWLAEVAPSERAFFEGFFTWVYTPRAHADGTVDQIVEEALAFPHKQSVEAFQAQVDVCLTHDTEDRLPQIAAPTLVLSGEHDIILPPRVGRSVAAQIPNARFEVMPGEAHQPFQEVPEEFNARVEAFWREVEAQG